MTQKIALITGANSGLGKATAIALAQQTYQIIMVSRSRERGEVARAEIKSVSGSQQVDLLVADLASQADIRKLADQVLSGWDRLDVLINNAGTSFYERKLTTDGIEATFAVNHLAGFLLTHLLLDRLKASAPSRIVNVASRVNVTVDLDDPQFERRKFGSLRAYAESKVCVIMFTYALAARLPGTGVTVNCVHPGVFRSNLGVTDSRGSEPWLMRVILAMGQPFLNSAEKAAGRVVHLASSPEFETIHGKYYGDKVELQSPPQTYDKVAIEKLWALSSRLTGLS
ncbi:MAG: SDR family oxidoreductase [Anaerolineae bacterium]